jgi:selenocysteine-specific elongation factor
MEKCITIGVAGHVDHGKTSLVQCLTGIDTDRLKEEKQRGLSIEPGIALLKLPSNRQIALMDVPGHSDFLKNTIRGLSSVDLAILVVAADDGVMPQTLDHLEVLKFLRAGGGFVVLSKTDLVDNETVELAEQEICDVVKGTFLEGKPVLPFSALDGRGLPKIVTAIESESKRSAGKTHQAPFRLWIDQARSIPGFGTVVSGTIQSGILRQDDVLHLLPAMKETKARFLEVHHQKVSQAVAGQRVGINLHKISLQEANPGMVLASPELLTPTYFFNAELTLLKKMSRPMLNHERVKLYLGTTVTNTMVVVMKGERLNPGETGLVQFRLQEPLAVLPRDSFVISPMNRNTIIGGGLILELSREKFRAIKAEKTVGYLQPLHQGDLKTVVPLFFQRCPSRAVSIDEMIRGTGFPEEKIRKEVESRVRSGELIDLEGRGFFPKARYGLLKKKLMEVAGKILGRDAFKLSVASEELRHHLDPSLEDAPFESLLRTMIKEGKLIQVDGMVRIPNFTVGLSPEREKMTERLLNYARNLGYESFSAGFFCKLYGEVFDKGEVQKLLDHLHAQKRLIRLNNNRFLTLEALEEIKGKVREVILSKGSLTLLDIKEVFGYGRTQGIPVLEHLDTIGFTRRIGDERVLVEKNGCRVTDTK